jgi:hypothetical protein
MSTTSDTKIEAVLKDAIKANHIQAYEQQFKLSFYTNILKQVKALSSDVKQFEALESTFIQLNSAEQKMLQYAFKQLTK